MKKILILSAMILLLTVGALAQSDREEEDKRIYVVVVNHEEQYSIWPADREVPLGWRATGFKGTKQACLDNIKEIWTDMRPLSLRKKMEEEAARASGAPTPKPPEPAPAKTEPEEPLDAEAVAALLEQFGNGLPELLEDEDGLSEIMEKWDAREDLAGKTKKQILELLFTDVKAVVADKETQDKIWSAWTGEKKDADKTPG